jgi:hypothetical protein
MIRRYKVFAFCPGVNLNQGYDTGSILELEDECLCQFAFITALKDAGCLDMDATIDDVILHDEPDGVRVTYAYDGRPMLRVKMM